jgi:phage-related protein
MSAKLKRGMAKQIVELRFGQIKHATGFRQVLPTGIENMKATWTIICTAHNLLKLARTA